MCDPFFFFFLVSSVLFLVQSDMLFFLFCLYPHMSNQEVEYANCVISKTVVCWVMRHKWVRAFEEFRVKEF